MFRWFAVQCSLDEDGYECGVAQYPRKGAPPIHRSLSIPSVLDRTNVFFFSHKYSYASLDPY